MKVSGMNQPTKEMAEVTRYGLMDLFTKVIGKMIKQMVEVDSSMQMVMFMRESSAKICIKASECTLSKTATNTPATGSPANKKAEENKQNQPDKSTKANGNPAKRTVTVT